MPCGSDPSDEADAGLVADTFSIPVIRSISNPRTTRYCPRRARRSTRCRKRCGRPSTNEPARVALGNVRPRLRMAALYFVANSLNYLVAGTGNRSELTIGYFTKHGDGGVDCLPIGHLLKSQVRTLAQELGVPQAIIDKAPSAGLWLGQTDESEMGFSYADLERYLTDGPGGRLARARAARRANDPLRRAQARPATDAGIVVAASRRKTHLELEQE